MKGKNIMALAIAAIVSLQCSNAFDLKSIINSGNGSNTTSASDIIGAVTSIIGGADVDYASLVGTWKYANPAISFKSDNLLQKAGGAAASSTITSKIKPYYEKAGLTSLVIEFKEDSTFVAKAGKLNLTGTVSDQGEGNYTFNIKALGKIPSGKINGFVEKSGSNIQLTFDASRLIDIASKIASASGNATLQSATSLLNSYDGLNAGFEMQKK